MVDDELRKVAEDMRALARSLAKDFRDAVDQAHRSGHPATEAFKHGLRGVAREVKRGARANWYPPGYGWHSRPRRPCPPPTRAPGGQNWSAAAPWAPPWGPPPRVHQHRSRAPLPPVRRRWDATTVIGILAVLFGVAWLLGVIHAVHLSVEAVVATALMLLGAALVITGRTDWSLSRRSWPVWLGGAMIVVLIATSSTFGVGSGISFGNTLAHPTSSGTIHGGFGNLTVDATNLTPGSTVDIQSIAGQTYVKNVPSDATVQVNAHVFAGQICVNGQNMSSGVSAATSTAYGTTGPDELTFNIHQAFGQVFVGNQNCSGHSHP